MCTVTAEPFAMGDAAEVAEFHSVPDCGKVMCMRASGFVTAPRERWSSVFLFDTLVVVIASSVLLTSSAGGSAGV